MIWAAKVFSLDYYLQLSKWRRAYQVKHWKSDRPSPPLRTPKNTDSFCFVPILCGLRLVAIIGAKNHRLTWYGNPLSISLTLHGMRAA